jgi:vacuolar-type H+-ATPase catalytic subunit A/Vma1
MRDANMYDVCRVSDERLIGEIIEMHGDQASIQVYEETQGLGPGAPVESTGAPLSVELGPGLIGSIYDGIQRPLNKILEVTGSNLLARGVEVPSLDRGKKWDFVASAKEGDAVRGGRRHRICQGNDACHPENYGTVRNGGNHRFHPFRLVYRMRMPVPVVQTTAEMR